MAFDPSAPVLVVDGHDAEIAILRALLRRLRAVNVDDAPDGGAALAKMRAKRYGLVIASWDMAPLTARDFLYQMRSDPGLSRIPLVVTGESKSDNVIAAKKAGANSYIVKPFDAQALKVKIDAAFATKAAPLLERQHAATQAAPLPERAAAAAPSSSSGQAEAAAAARTKFDGLFTVSLK
jgi:two-component system, chemotaxis family, chemotaxis protein CheY